MDVDGLSGQQGDEKEVLLEDSLSAGASLTRAEGHSHALVRYTPLGFCLLYTSPSPRDRQKSRMPSSA